MKIDNTQPWVESKVKLPKLGKVIKAMLEVEKARTTNTENLTVLLSDIDRNVHARLTAFDNTLKAAITAHTSKAGPAHGETKGTIGLSNKENLPAAKLSDILAQNYKREFLTPQTLHGMIEDQLSIDQSLYVKSGTFPLSYGVTLGRALFNQRYIGVDSELRNESPANVSRSLFSTEDGYLLFADHGGGYDSNFSEGGVKAPIGTTMVSIINDNIAAVKGTPASFNDITASDKFVSGVTGLEFGFADGRGNYYDSNFHPSVAIDTSSLSASPAQSIESTLFDPSMVYKPDGTYTFRNFNLTKHNFTELTPLMDGLYPFNHVSLLSNDDFAMHTANCRIVQEENVWGIEFDFLSGSVGVSDWLGENLRRSTNKIVGKRAEYVIRQTTINAISGYAGAKGYTRISSGQFPTGFSVNRKNFQGSNFNAGQRYSSAFIPIEALISGFNAQTAAKQQALVNRIDLDLLKRITLAWDNKLIYKGMLRIPFYLKHSTDTTKAHNCWVDVSFRFNIGADYTTVDMSALNFNSATRPTLDANMNLTGNLGKFTEHTTNVLNDPLNPKVIGGCFVETGGHLRAYTVGHRQYICYYKHQVKSAKQWIGNNETPVITETKVRDTNMFPCNGFYGDSIRNIPVIMGVENTTYLSYLRNKKGKYAFATYTLPVGFDLVRDTVANPNNIVWLDRAGEKEIPVLLSNTNMNSSAINISGMIFSEANNFTGCFDPNFNSASFQPNRLTTIERPLQERIIRNSKIVNPYAIFFYFQNVLCWAIADRYGVKNSEGNDLCLGGVRVDTYQGDDDKFEIRQLPTMTEQYVWGKLFEKELPTSYFGRNKESFDDIFILKTEQASNGLSVFMNFPLLPGKYYQFNMVMDGLGYYYPTPYTGDKLNMDALNGVGTKVPHQFYPNYPAPMLTPQHFYHFSQTLYGGVEYSSAGAKTFMDYYMGWKNEFPLYVIGSNITVNGRSLLVDKTVTLKPYDLHEGAVFITYNDEGAHAYSMKYNPAGYVTEPSSATIFAGFWYKSKDVYSFSYHAIRGIASLEYADFLNGLLPTVDNKQFAPYAMGSTFPFYLGKIKSTPRQYFFKK